MNNISSIKVFILFSTLSCTNFLHAGQVFQHQGPPPQLVELYTSEGCSSCPPADQYLSQFLNHPKLWQDVVPLAFHVDYWDYLGWKDPFAHHQFKERQYRYRRNGNIKSVYTPGWVVNGVEWRGFFNRQALPEYHSSDNGLLSAELKGRQLNIHYQPVNTQSDLIAHIALLGFDLSSRVMAGENSGRTLNHQFVVLHKQAKQQKLFEWAFTLPMLSHGQRQALAIWITDTNQIPIQVTADWIKPKK